MKVFVFQAKSKVREVFNQVCGNLGLREAEYFGLTQFTGTFTYNCYI